MRLSTIRTVTGEVNPGQLGVTLTHEHLWCDISVQSGRPDNVLHDVPLMAEELQAFARRGGKSIVELTPEGIGRNADQLKAISLLSGVNIVSGIAFYVESTYPAWVPDAPVETIADYFVSHIEAKEGVPAGLIGELASHNEPLPNAAGYRLTDLEERVFRAAAQAQRRTGVAISTHAALGRAGHSQLNILEDAGADLTKVAIGHCDAHWHEDPALDMAYYLPILARGAYCQFDMIGWTDLAPDQVRAERVAALVKLGHERRMLLSTDTCRLSQLHRNGGRGFDYLFETFLPRLRDLGVSDSSIHSMMCEAPRNLLTISET
ncbi:MAG: hypothetical protein ABIZ80_24210 [Bryobacteraceae bacterium]